MKFHSFSGGLAVLLSATAIYALPTVQQPLLSSPGHVDNHTITPQLFTELEELARIVDISYCVGMSGVQKPFQCLGRCKDFPNFELVETWNTGVLLSDSCGYIALDHSPTRPRIILAFRGTYSLANTIADLSTIPQKYVPYAGESNDGDSPEEQGDPHHNTTSPCDGCSVHSGFLRSWQNTHDTMIPTVSNLIVTHPSYKLHLIGHSLGGAVALLGGLEMSTRGWRPTITTFGEPRVGNEAFVEHIDARFQPTLAKKNGLYRRITHVDDPVVLLPLTEWGYLPHAGELYISKPSLPPDVIDIRLCDGDNDRNCSAGADRSLKDTVAGYEDDGVDLADLLEQWKELMMRSASQEADSNEDIRVEAAEQTLQKRGLIPARYKLWQLFFAHRDYFWRLGVCLPGGDPFDWNPRPPTDAASVESVDL